jgi:hypothetical protein
MRQIRVCALFFSLLATAGTANAQDMVYRAKGLRLYPQPSVPSGSTGLTSGRIGLWSPLTGPYALQPLWRNADGTDSSMLGGGGGGAVSSVSNSDGSLTISPTTGAVVGSLNLAHANTWSGVQTFRNATALINNAVNDAHTTLASVAASNRTATFPDFSGPVGVLQSSPTTQQTGTLFLDSSSALAIGSLLSANSVTLSGSTAPFPGLRVATIDTPTAAALNVGASTATSMVVTPPTTFNGVVTFNKDQGTTPNTGLSTSGTINTDASTSNEFPFTLVGNGTLANPTNVLAGHTYLWSPKQDGTGSRTLAYGTNFKWQGGTAPTLTTTANAVDWITCVARTTTELDCTWQGDFR